MQRQCNLILKLLIGIWIVFYLETKLLVCRVHRKGLIVDVGLLLENHGVVCLGTSMLEGFDKIELLERAAQMTIATEQMKAAGYTVSSLRDERLKGLMVMKGKA